MIKRRTEKLLEEEQEYLQRLRDEETAKEEREEKEQEEREQDL